MEKLRIRVRRKHQHRFTTDGGQRAYRREGRLEGPGRRQKNGRQRGLLKLRRRPPPSDLGDGVVHDGAHESSGHPGSEDTE